MRQFKAGLFSRACLATLVTLATPTFPPNLARADEASPQASGNAVRTTNAEVAALLRQGQWKEALALATHNLSRARELLDEKHPDFLTALNQYAVSLGITGRAAEALPHQEQALQLRIEVLGETHPDTITSLANYASLLQALGRPADALHHHQRVLKLRTDIFGETHPGTLSALQSYANALRVMGRIDEALPHFERSLQQRVATLGEDHVDSLTALNNYANGLLVAGRTADALPLLERTVKLRSRIRGEKHPETLNSLNNYAYALQAAGRAAEALLHYERALKLSTEVLGERHPGTLIALGGYAYTLHLLGRTQDALPHIARAYHLSVAVLGESHSETLTSLSTYATLLHAAGRPQAALPYYERAVAVTTAVRGPKHPDTVRTIANYANVLRTLGRMTDAMPHFQRALDLALEVHGEQHPNTLIAMNNHASLLQATGRSAEAIALSERALATRVKVLGEKHPNTLTSFVTHAQLLEKLDRRPEALTYYAHYVAGAESQREQTGRDSADSQRSLFRNYLQGYHRYIEALMTAGQAREGLAILERTKARTLLEHIALRSAAAGSGVPDADAKRLLDYPGRIGALDTRIAQAGNALTRETLRAERNTLSRELAELKRSLQAQYPPFRRISEVELATADDAPTLLTPDSVFVSYVVMNATTVKALILHPTGEVAQKDLGIIPGLAESIEAHRVWTGHPGGRTLFDDTGRAIRILHWTENNAPRWRVTAVSQMCTSAQLNPITPPSMTNDREEPPLTRGLDVGLAGSGSTDCVPPGASVVSSDDDYRQLTHYLGARLLEPLASQLAGKSKILISPDGPLGLVSWDVLPIGDKPLVSVFEVSQVQSLSVLKLLRSRQAEYRHDRSRASLLAMGNPDYGGPRGTPTKRITWLRSPFPMQGVLDHPADRLRTLKWRNLPGTQSEMDHAAKLFAGQSRVISGRSASESTLRTLSAGGQLGNYRYLLFAAHGYFDPIIPAFSSLVLTPEGPEPERDGYVTIGEWVGMRLQSDLTVLSACNTARGETISGEGLMGMAYALYVAGNVNTVLTLWPVADEDTAEFVSSLLAKIKAGQSHAQALTGTKRAFLNHPNPRKRSPSIWAPFVLYGT